MDNQLTINTTQLSIGYSNDLPVAKNISIDIPTNTFVGLVGRNGSGKSTLIKTLARLIQPLSGEITINDTPIKSFPPKLFAKMLSIMFSQQSIPGFTTVYDLVSLGRYPHTNYFGKLYKDDLHLIEQAMDWMEIHPLKDRMAITLSDGEKQKVLLARALAQDTPIVLLDEPTTFLDLPSKHSFFKHLKTIRDETDKTLIIASHEWNLLNSYCSNFIVFSNQEVIEKTSIEEEIAQIHI